MTTRIKILLLLGALASVTLLAGCPGMPGAPGQQQQLPPGVTPPPGMESGGARTLLGTTITPPDDSYLLVSYSYENREGTGAAWPTCRRIIPLESSILIEGLNHDGRMEGAPEDENLLLPYEGLEDFSWKYEPKPQAAAESEDSAAAEGEDDGRASGE